MTSHRINPADEKDEGNVRQIAARGGIALRWIGGGGRRAGKQVSGSTKVLDTLRQISSVNGKHFL